MRFVIVFILLVTSPKIYANDVANYLKEYGRTGVSNYSVEQEISKNNDFDGLLKKLNPFYSDTLTSVRQKAYYLTYKKALLSPGDRAAAAKVLLKGGRDNDGGIVGQNLGFLKSFNREDFDEESASMLALSLTNPRVQHYKDFVLLAGFIGVGKDILFQRILDQNVSAKTKWYLSLALARMGNSEQITYCMNKVKSLPINDNLVDYAIADLVYMRQKESIDYCISILNSNEKLCHSLNPDNSESILCGYRILEMLAPVVVNIPVTVDASGSLSSDNYESQLESVRQWFLNNPEYQLKTNVY